MPFDATQLQRPTITVPPTPPEPGGVPRRIRIAIEIVERRQQSLRPAYRLGTFTLILFALLLIATLAHAQTTASGPIQWQSYQQGWQTPTRAPTPRASSGPAAATDRGS
jgi:hypothetical protein